MKRTALSFFGRKFYSNKIKNYENKYLEIYVEDWSDKPWEDFAKDCFKLETETKELIFKSTGGKSAQCDHPNPVEVDHPNPGKTDQANPVQTDHPLSCI